MCLVAVQIIRNCIDKHFVLAQNIICPQLYYQLNSQITRDNGTKIGLD